VSLHDTFPPVFATNRVDTDQTVAAEINRMLRGLREDLAAPPELAIATAYLNPGGFDLVADEIEQAPVVRLLLGAEPQAPMWRTVDEASPVELLDNGLRTSRDLTGFTVEADRSARRLVAWLRKAEATGKPRVEVRRFNKGFLHGKAFIAIHPSLPAVLAGSSNFTLAGLSRNRELNLGYPSGQYTQLVIDWFNEQWEDADPYDLAAFYEARWLPHPPWIVFLKMLHELYGADRDGDDRRLGLELTGFQRDGVSRALRILDELGGVLVCDEVGLGKTFIAGEIVHQASIRDRQQVLIITPAALKNSLWVPFLRRFNLYTNRVQVVSYDDVRLGNRPELENLDQYALVVIDEAHNLRNPTTQRAKAVEQLLGGEYRKKLVLLTATPVNNGLLDLYTLVSFFVRSDSHFASIGIPSIAKYIGHAQAQDPHTLSPEHLFDLMNQVAVRRTRHFIKKEYAGETLIGPDGRPQTIEFPTPRLHRVEYELTEIGTKLLDTVVYALDDPLAENDPPIPLRQRLKDRCSDPKRLSMARYMPSLYALDEDLEARQVSSAGLLESILLKRLESSAVALRKTLDKLITSHETFLRGLEGGIVLSGRLLQEFGESDDEVDEFLDQVDDELLSGVEKAAAFDAEALGDRVRLDVVLLGALRSLAADAAAVDDPKVGKLLAILEETVREAERPSKDGVSASDRRKLIVFSTYADTVLHLREEVVEAIAEAPSNSPLAMYQERIPEAIFGSKTGISQEGRAATLAGFAPHTAGLLDEDGTPLSEDRHDILFATDVLSEGVNLQQAGHMVSVDLPWNPMRLVQRHGRIDRIGSHHRHIDIDCYFPATDLDRLLRLEERLQRKIAYANAAIGMGQVLPGQTADPTVEVTLHDLRRQIEDIHDERTELFETSGGSAALSGEEYRRRLEKAIADSRVRADALALPYGAGSGFASSNLRLPGWVFCARIANHPQPWFRFVVADEQTWTPYLRPETGDAWIVEDTLASLVAADPGERDAEQNLPEAASEGVFEAWALAQEHIFRSWSWLTDVANLQPDVPLALREAAELVANHGAHLGVETQQDLVQRLNGRWDKRIVNRVREIVRSENPANERIEKLVEFVSGAGLEPPPPATPLPVIERAEVRLVCWMAVSVATAG
jgi:hypothetical protein